MSLLDSLACREIISIDVNFTVKQAIELMRTHEISSIFIEESNHLVGIITERDLVRVVASNIDLQVTTVLQTMSKNVISLPATTMLDEALVFMEKVKIRHLLVTNSDGTPKGVITHTDIVRKLEEDFFKAPRPVKEYMTRVFDFTPPETPLQDAVKKMYEKRHSCVLVGSRNEIVGIVTERDIVRLIQQGNEFTALKIQDVMTSPVISIPPDLSLYEASRLMDEQKIRHLVICDSNQCMGLITNSDVVKSIRDNYRTYLEKEAMRTRKILDLIHEGVIEIDADSFAIEWTNQTGANMLGFSSISDALGKKFLILFEERDCKQLEQDFTNKKARSNVQCSMNSADLTTMLLSYDFIQNDYKDTQKTFIRILLRDITAMVENRKKMEEKLRRQKEQFQALFDNTTDAIVMFNTEKKILMANQQFLNMFDYTMDKIIEQDVCQIVDADQKKRDHIAEIIFQGKTASRETVRYTSTGREVWVQLKGGPVIVDNEITGGYVVYTDISERQEMITMLQKNEAKYRTLIQSMNEGMALHELVYDGDEVVDYRFLEVNAAYEQHLGTTAKKIKGMLSSMIHQSSPFLDVYKETAITGIPNKFEAFINAVNKHFRISVFSPQKGYFATILEDITENKRKEERIQYLIYHDLVTGLNNRAYFEKQLKELDTEKELPISLIVADVNGLKLVNDAFGHEKGDLLIKTAAEVIQESCRDTDIVARTGGDEFTIILPKTTEADALVIINNIRTKSSTFEVEGIQLSIALGCATKEIAATNIYEVLKISEAEMYNRKLTESKDAKSKLVDSLLSVLSERTCEPSDHSENVAQLSTRLGEKLGINEDGIEKLRLLALLHDIGNIMVPPDVLHKENPLTVDEWKIIRKHSETGYRIANAVPEFAGVAEYILCHHERNDGSGYPRGLEGEEIPLFSRILSVVDAYDAMTTDKPYRKALTQQEAIEELRNHAGTQFDPHIVESFINDILRH
ncbi:hypothetical protein BHU72_04000 [Desulfuribacillus stibiiarsenatis]|uniref:Histidine kinase n=1 Tax=Desulfuribacillus stibiiarsenatis TaxID=1390249 RepID=A0A1E5L547_9FIRM|nr:CBS domain-containing protein [Desulfuribacillus stibiiarsenatis]OEH85267.1 hypothetical protein BHU72_04000 [Desulfuribacillus stibiiarsenatis]